MRWRLIILTERAVRHSVSADELAEEWISTGKHDYRTKTHSKNAQYTTSAAAHGLELAAACHVIHCADYATTVFVNPEVPQGTSRSTPTKSRPGVGALRRGLSCSAHLIQSHNKKQSDNRKTSTSRFTSQMQRSLTLHFGRIAKNEEGVPYMAAE